MSEIPSKVPPLLASRLFPPHHHDVDVDVDVYVDVDVFDDEACVANREILDKFVQ